MYRIDRSGEAGLRHDGEPPRLSLGQRRIGCHHHQGGALALAALGAVAQRLGRNRGRQAEPAELGMVLERRRPEPRPAADHRRAGRVDGGERADRVARGGRRRGRADAALEVERGGAEAGPDAAEREFAGGAFGRRITEVPVGGEAAPILVAPGQQVEQDRARHDRHPCGAHRKAAAALAQPSLDAAAGFEAEGRPARQRDPVDALDGVGRLQQIGVARARPAAAHVDAGDRRLLEHDRGDARGHTVVLRMADQDPGDIGYKVA